MHSLLRTKLAFLPVLLTVWLMAGCNFFGKQEDNYTPMSIGSLSNGQNIIGTWSLSSTSPDIDGNPSDAFTESYTFDPVGGAQVRLRDPHKSGLDCIAYGQYRISGQTVTIYVQTVSDTDCGFSSQMNLYSVTLSEPGHYIRVSNATGTTTYRFLVQRTSISALVGLWSFGGEGGIDFIWFDEYGYFVMQITEDNQPTLLTGYYQALASGGLRLVFFSDSMFDSISSALEFEGYLTNGTQLQLDYSGDNGFESYVGTRL